MKPVICIAHTQEIFAYGVSQTLQNKNCSVAPWTNSGIEALQLILEKQPEIALLEAQLEHLDAFDIIKTCLEKGVSTRFIIIFQEINPNHLIVSKALAIAGIVHAKDRLQIIEDCFAQVLQNKTFITPSFSSETVAKIDMVLLRLEQLSHTETQILKYISTHTNSAEIAKILAISERTIEKHRSNIITKLKLDKKSNSLTKWVLQNPDLIKTLRIRTTT